jgi:hypothetical protein
MKPLLSILMLFLGMAAACVASQEQFVFESLPDNSGPAANAARAGIPTNTPPLTNLVVVDELIKNLPPPANLPPTPPALQSPPKTAPVEPAETSDETAPSLPALIPSSKVAPVRIEPAAPPEAEVAPPEESNPVVQAPVPTNTPPPVSPPVVQTAPPPVLPAPQPAPVAPQSLVPPPVKAGPLVVNDAAVQPRVHTNAPPPVAKTKPKKEQFVFAPLPTAPDAHPDLTVHYDAVKDSIAPPAHVGDPEPARPAVEKKSLPLSAAGAKLIVSPSHEFYGTVAAVDPHGRFVVLNFPLGQMPAVDTVLPVFRHGVNVGQVKITGPQRDDNTAADVISGDLQVDDDARD